MPPPQTDAGGPAARTTAGPRCIVVVFDLVSAEMDAYGPMSMPAARQYAARTEHDLEESGIDGVKVMAVALTESTAVAARAAPSGA
jgi:hypothetical protein